jgi:hypothetical protein
VECGSGEDFGSIGSKRAHKKSSWVSFFVGSLSVFGWSVSFFRIGYLGIMVGSGRVCECLVEARIGVTRNVDEGDTLRRPS